MQREIGIPPRLSVIEADRRTTQIAHHQLVQKHVVGFEKFDARAQPFIEMRAKVLNLAKENDLKVFAITSIEPNAGKTHIAINLAAALSRITPTVLVELDLRRPSIASRLGLCPPGLGVDDFLSGQALWSKLGLRIHGFDLDVRCVRAARDDAEELLTANALPRLFERVRTMQDRPICIVDTSPMTVEDDFMLIAPEIDGVLMVVDEGRTTKRALLNAVDVLKPTPIVGSILNRSLWHSSTGDYYGYYGG